MNELKSLTLNGKTYDSFRDQEAQGKEPFWVTVTDNGDGTYSADRTHTEILAAHRAGRAVWCKLGNLVYPLTTAVTAVCSFGDINNTGLYRQVSIGSADKVTVSTQQLGGAVKSVNGVEPDDSGNVNIPVPEGASKDEIVSEVIEKMGTAVYGWIDDENNIRLAGALTAGTYVFKYEDDDGNTVDIGTYTVADGTESPIIYAASNYLVAYSATGEPVYHKTEDPNGNVYGVIYCNAPGSGIYTSAELTEKSSVIKPIPVPEGKTTYDVIFPDTVTGTGYAFRNHCIGLTYDNNRDCWIKTTVSGTSEYGTMKNTIPADTSYILINFNASGYKDISGLDFTGIKVEWE